MVYFEVKHQKRLRALALLINSFQTRNKENSFESLEPKERSKLREVSYELLEIANHYKVKRDYRNEDRQINRNFEKDITKQLKEEGIIK